MIESVEFNRRITLAPHVLQEIESVLNDDLFFGYSVGVTINDALINAFYNSKRIWNWRTRATDHIRYFYQRFNQPAFSKKDLSQYSGRIVFTLLFDRADIKALVIPIMESYGNDETIILGSTPSMRTQLPDGNAFISWSELPPIDMKLWRKEFDLCVPKWKIRLKQVLKKHSVPQYVVKFLLCRLQIQTQRIMASKFFLDKVIPTVIVTEYDRNEHASCLLLAAKQKGIPSVTMIHGCLETYPSYGMSPILASYACCWGQRHKAIMMEHGVREEQLVITGCQRLTRGLSANREAARMKMSVGDGLAVVLLATSPIKAEDKIHYASVFCSAMVRLSEVFAIVRLHPAEDIIEYQYLIEKFPNVRFLINEILTQDESLAAADLVINHESGFGNDALLKGKLVVILDVLSSQLKNGKELIELAGCPCVKDENELISVTKIILSDEIYSNILYENALSYAKQYCDTYDLEAVNNICHVIDMAIDNVDMI
jgi:hypothetical protein